MINGRLRRVAQFALSIYSCQLNAFSLSFDYAFLRKYFSLALIEDASYELLIKVSLDFIAFEPRKRFLDKTFLLLVKPEVCKRHFRQLTRLETSSFADLVVILPLRVIIFFRPWSGWSVVDCPSVLVLEEECLFLVQQKTEQECKILPHTNDVSNVQMFVKVSQCFLFEPHLSILLTKLVSVAQNPPVRRLFLVCLCLSLALHTLRVSLC